MGIYDPFCDDPRLAVQKVHYSSLTGQLAVGGRAGHVILYNLESEPLVNYFFASQFFFSYISLLFVFRNVVFFFFFSNFGLCRDSTARSSSVPPQRHYRLAFISNCEVKSRSENGKLF